MYSVSIILGEANCNSKKKAVDTFLTHTTRLYEHRFKINIYHYIPQKSTNFILNTIERIK
jgi:hypothetical protein